MNHNHTQHSAPDWFGASAFKGGTMNAEAELNALRRIIKRHADEAEWALRQEGDKVHRYCEGHAVCDLINSAIYDANQIA